MAENFGIVDEIVGRKSARTMRFGRADWCGLGREKTHDMETSKGLILVDILIVAGAVALAVVLYYSPRHRNSPNKPADDVHQQPPVENQIESVEGLPSVQHD